eukprot:TRINITY_DN1258_c0_g1_i1.p1 TRINITY_DN1258_c0_g1~~TRINITY_DN1258_c0_g1_i1.p1  ORF type:complete len:211 (-),score=44.95 TRINITY_DN1258_c0_g1_i1:1881-2513(-)
MQHTHSSRMRHVLVVGGTAAAVVGWPLAVTPSAAAAAVLRAVAVMLPVGTLIVTLSAAAAQACCCCCSCCCCCAMTFCRFDTSHCPCNNGCSTPAGGGMAGAAPFMQPPPAGFTHGFAAAAAASALRPRCCCCRCAPAAAHTSGPAVPGMMAGASLPVPASAERNAACKPPLVYKLRAVSRGPQAEAPVSSARGGEALFICIRRSTGHQR